MSVIEKNGFVEDGNHRIAIAELLYSSDKKVPCIYKTVIQRWNIKDEIDVVLIIKLLKEKIDELVEEVNKLKE